MSYPFWYGGLASITACCCTHPLDLTKARMQTATVPRGFLGTIGWTVSNEGLRGLYDGLSASILRQATYSTVRIGAYEEMKQRIAPRYNGRQPPTGVLLMISTLSGLVGSIIGNPADVVNVRMQNDRTLAPELRRGYTNCINGLWKLYRDEGFRSLFAGLGPNCVRGILMTTSQVVSYDIFKLFLVNHGFDPKSNHTFFVASLATAFVATTVCSPADVIKTQIMNARGSVPIWQLLRKRMKLEGVRFLFRGWTPSFTRLGPQTILTFLVLEQLKRLGWGVRS